MKSFLVAAVMPQESSPSFSSGCISPIKHLLTKRRPQAVLRRTSSASPRSEAKPPSVFPTKAVDKTRQKIWNHRMLNGWVKSLRGKMWKNVVSVVRQNIASGKPHEFKLRGNSPTPNRRGCLDSPAKALANGACNS
jgi:hypothetical protein